MRMKGRGCATMYACVQAGGTRREQREWMPWLECAQWMPRIPVHAECGGGRTQASPPRTVESRVEQSPSSTVNKLQLQSAPHLAGLVPQLPADHRGDDHGIRVPVGLRRKRGHLSTVNCCHARCFRLLSKTELGLSCLPPAAPPRPAPPRWQRPVGRKKKHLPA